MTLLLALLAQVGPFTPPGTASPSPLPPEIQERKSRSAPVAAAQMPSPIPSADLQRCLDDADSDPTGAVAQAETWAEAAKGETKALAFHCLGLANARLERFHAAREAFVAARDATAIGSAASRARLATLAGNAALATGDAAGGLALLDAAATDAGQAKDTGLAGLIAIDRARALVPLGRTAEAAKALEQARIALPGNAQAWLLSATLSRRLGKLAEAQGQIEKAAALLPVDPEIGLEAGVIAMLAGREDAARKSWQSVLGAAPDSPAAATARGYLAQLAPAVEAKP